MIQDRGGGCPHVGPRRASRVLGLRPASAGARQARAKRPRGGAPAPSVVARLAPCVAVFVSALAPHVTAAPSDTAGPPAPSATAPTASFPSEPFPSASASSAPPAPTLSAASATPATTAAPPPIVYVTPEDRRKREALELVSRQNLLAGYTNSFVYRKNWGEGFGYVSAAIGAIGIPVAASVYDDDKPAALTWLVGFSASTAVVGASLFATRDTRVDILEAVTQFNGGVIMLGLAVADDPGDWPRLSTGAAAGVGFGEALLLGINSFARRTPTSTLRSHRDRLQQGPVSRAELAAAERDFLGADVPFGQGILALPYGVGAVVAVVPAFDAKNSSDERLVSGLIGGVLGLDAIVIALTPTLVSSYRANTQGVGLSLLAGPGNFTLRYRF